jgi:single-stranded-DNA-specific exonuclease
MQGVLETDGELAAGELSLETALALEGGGPWGQSFPEPMFDGEFAVVESRVIADRHLKLWVRPVPASPPIEAIAFGYFDNDAGERPAAGARVRLAYRLQSTRYGGTERLEMLAESVQTAA